MNKKVALVKSFPKTLSDRIYIYLKEAIMSGDIKPKQRLVEKEIAAEFGISTTPVREAIKKLSGERLIIIDSHKEAVVREISYKELLHIYETMVCIDEKCIRLAFEQEKHTLLTDMTNFIARMEVYWKEKNLEKFLECNERMHLRIAELSGNEFMCQIRQTINAQLCRYRPLRLFLFRNSDAIYQCIKTAKMLLQAIKSEDSKMIAQIEAEDWIHHLPSEAEWLEFQKSSRDTDLTIETGMD